MNQGKIISLVKKLNKDTKDHLSKSDKKTLEIDKSISKNNKKVKVLKSKIDKLNALIERNTFIDNFTYGFGPLIIICVFVYYLYILFFNLFINTEEQNRIVENTSSIIVVNTSDFPLEKWKDGKEALWIGKSGDDVKILQQRIFGIDGTGNFDKNLQEKVKQFQKTNGLEPDGIFGKKSYSVLRGDPSLMDLEIRFGPGIGQNAYRFSVPEGSTFEGSGVGMYNNYTYQNSVKVPFEVWNISSNPPIQMAVSFRDNENDGKFNLDKVNNLEDKFASSPEFIFPHNLPYDSTMSQSVITRKGGQLYNSYFSIWLALPESVNFDVNTMPLSSISFKRWEFSFWIDIVAKLIGIPILLILILVILDLLLKRNRNLDKDKSKVSKESNKISKELKKIDSYTNEKKLILEKNNKVIKENTEIFNNLKMISDFLKLFDKDDNGKFDIAETANINLLITKYEKNIRDIEKNESKNYLEELIRLKNYINEYQNNLTKEFNSIKIRYSYGIPVKSNIKKFIKNYKFYQMLISCLVLMIDNIVKDKLSSYYNIKEDLDKLNIWNSNYQNETIQLAITNNQLTSQLIKVSIDGHKNILNSLESVKSGIDRTNIHLWDLKENIGEKFDKLSDTVDDNFAFYNKKY
tara:strand:- start:2690 stop:4588 length:1899 start_codon:yes stop_codon:yes gene_type:complete